MLICFGSSFVLITGATVVKVVGLLFSRWVVFDCFVLVTWLGLFGLLHY